MHIAYLLTGGNLGDRSKNINAARSAIEACGVINKVSHIYQTAAWGDQEQPPFLNQGIELQTHLPPSALLHALLEIEKKMGRIRKEKYGPRLIDIDILFYDKEVIDDEGLTIPHPEIQNRRFALACISDMAPHYMHPVLQKTITRLLKECTDPLPVQKWK